MKRLIIRAIGPIKEADITLNRFNVIIGMQSSGKSCVLRIASYCAWVEKQIQLSQSSSMFDMGTTFMDRLCRYHRMSEFMHPDSYIQYETDTMMFSYSSETEKFKFEWNEKGRYEYKLPKISYIPSERNVVSLFPKWKNEVSAYDCVLDYMKEWDISRNVIGESSEILNLGINYIYNKSLGADLIHLGNGKDIPLSHASSGLQSLVPLFVLVDYITNYIYLKEADEILGRTEAKREKMNRLVDLMYANIKRSQSEVEYNEHTDEHIVRNEEREYRFRSEVAAERFGKLIFRYLTYQHTDMYLEEPENNLFPPTQGLLIDWLDSKTRQHVHPASIFMTTHSPYVLSCLMDKNLRGKRFFFTYEDPEEKGMYRVKDLSQKEIEQIIAGGVDMFFNYESYIA